MLLLRLIPQDSSSFLPRPESYTWQVLYLSVPARVAVVRVAYSFADPVGVLVERTFRESEAAARLRRSILQEVGRLHTGRIHV